MKKETLEVFTLPTDHLFAHLIILEGNEEINRLLFDEKLGEIKEVRLVPCGENLTDAAKAWLDEMGCDPTDDEIEFTVCSPKVQPAELAELKAKYEVVVLEAFARYRRDEIDNIELSKLLKTNAHGFNLFYLEASDIFFLHKERWPRVGQKIKITKVELTNDGVEFTMVHVRIP